MRAGAKSKARSRKGEVTKIARMPEPDDLDRRAQMSALMASLRRLNARKSELTTLPRLAVLRGGLDPVDADLATVKAAVESMVGLVAKLEQALKAPAGAGLRDLAGSFASAREQAADCAATLRCLAEEADEMAEFDADEPTKTDGLADAPMAALVGGAS